jgi:hypothetical protein
MCVCSVLSTDLYFQVRQARRRYTRLLTGALVNQLILRLIKCLDYPQPPKRGTPATVQLIKNDVDSSVVLVTPVKSGLFRHPGGLFNGETAPRDQQLVKHLLFIIVRVEYLRHDAELMFVVVVGISWHKMLAQDELA